ncbi:MAG: cytochrome c oxidase subunit II [Planctomycetota bacterium]
MLSQAVPEVETPVETGVAQSFWLPTPASTIAGEVDWLFYFILGIAIVFFVIIVVTMVVFVLKYRRPPGTQPPPSPDHNMALELTWSVIPTILVLAMFYFGFRGYINMLTAPANALEVQVTAQRWKWLFQYPNGYVDGNLHVPVDTPVQLVMRSEDVIHSFYVPDFRVKADVVPGRYRKLWFEATQVGTYDIFCAEYCGTEHSAMRALVEVHSPEGYQEWMDEAANWFKNLPPAEAGARVFQVQGCASCHGADGSGLQGPPLQQKFGREEQFNDGSRVIVDENYIRESILEPNAKIVAGYEQVPMPTYKGRLSDQDISFLIAFIKSLNPEATEKQDEAPKK